MAKKMDKNEILKFCKQVITEEVEKARFKVIEIILFGSRAKENARPDSDWDFYVVVDKQMDFKTKMKICGSIQMILAEEYIFCDIIINDIVSYQHLKKEKSSVSHKAELEGINI